MVAYLLAQQIVVLFLMMGLGMMLVRLKVVKSEDSRVLSLLTIYLIIPSTIIKAFQIDYTPEIRDKFLYAVLAAIVIHVMLFLVTAVLNKVFHLDSIEKTSIIYSNSGNLIIPLVVSVLGDQWVIYASAFLCVQMIFLFTHCESAIKGERSINLRKIFSNINLLAIIIGGVMFFYSIRLPKITYDVVASLAACIGPVSMIMLGMVMAATKWKSILSQGRLYRVTGIKMVVVPFLILLFLKYSGMAGWVEDGQTILLISLLAVITPSATLIVQFCQIYHQDEHYVGSINAVTTLVSIMTMPLLIWFYLNA